MRRILLIIILSVSMVRMSAQDADSLHLSQDHSFDWAALTLPAALVASGAIIHSVPMLHQQDVALRDFLADAGLEHTRVDNYLQYLPVASMLALRAVGVDSRHAYRDMVPIAAEAYLLGGIVVLGTKSLLDVQRPDGSAYNSFPSGHTFTAFAGAELLRREYGSDHPWIAVGGYVVAAGVGCMRIYNCRHWAADVLAGAGVGILSASVAYWTYPMFNRWFSGKSCRLEATPTSITLYF